MAQVIWTEPALSDLNEVAEYIALDNFGAAACLVQEVFSAVERLEAHPKSGRRPPELERKTRYREVVIGPCRVFYRVEDDEVYILYVMRGERELRVFLLQDRAKEYS
ncbi:MAG TPA: type II toxin-antitoxin system RelE/ParE family toxin [Gammaproteobacteria bacterium]|nr:type II toxin-antitoxin system RelE/ParE family toxin [Gammaproteobacteria bacterium]